MDLCDKLGYYKVKALGHRIRTLSYPVLALGAYRSLSDTDITTLAYSGLITILGICMYATSRRNITGRAYLYTKKIYQRNNELSEENFIESIRKSPNGKLHGYCEQQGIYLAAKELGYEDSFREAAKRASNVIIPFL